MPVMTAAEAMTAQLNALPEYLQPKEPGLFELLLKSAGRLRPDGGLHDAQAAAVIYKLQGYGAGYGDTPPPTSVSLPADHAMHLDCGNEWYWLSCHLDAVGADGGKVRIAILLDMLRFRLISKDLQAKAEWSDAECQLVWNAVTVTVSDALGGRMIRRSPNAQWAMVGGDVAFSPPDADFFYRCGPDTLKGSLNVLPLQVHVDDGDTMRLDLVVESEMAPDNAYFLQGEKGITPVPRPGIYYSWPQLQVSGEVTVEGKTYRASGTGWIDHQLLAPTVPSSDPGPMPTINGWNWCQFNFENGESYTCAAFQVGSISVNPLVYYGFHLKRDPASGWKAEGVIGSVAMDKLIATTNNVMQATSLVYTGTNFPNLLAPSPPTFDVTLTVAPWVFDGSFVTADQATPSEMPVSVTMVDSAPGPGHGLPPLGLAVTGVGFCETVSWEPWPAYVARATAFLEAHIR